MHFSDSTIKRTNKNRYFFYNCETGDLILCTRSVYFKRIQYKTQAEDSINVREATVDIVIEEESGRRWVQIESAEKNKVIEFCMTSKMGSLASSGLFMDKVTAEKLARAVLGKLQPNKPVAKSTLQFITKRSIVERKGRTPLITKSSILLRYGMTPHEMIAANCAIKCKNTGQSQDFVKKSLWYSALGQHFQEEFLEQISKEKVQISGAKNGKREVTVPLIKCYAGEKDPKDRFGVRSQCYYSERDFTGLNPLDKTDKYELVPLDTIVN